MRRSSQPQLSSSVMDRVRRVVQGAPAGHVHGPADFYGLGSRAAIDQSLSRLVRAGVLERVSRGLYQRPRAHPRLGGLLPSVDAVVRAISRKLRLRVQPAGAHAANLLGLSEQVPVRVVYLTDGATRTLRVGGQTLVLRHASPRQMATAGRVSGLVIQALRHLGRVHVDQRVMDVLRATLSPRDQATVARDAHLAPAWIAAILRDLVGKDV